MPVSVFGLFAGTVVLFVVNVRAVGAPVSQRLGDLFRFLEGFDRELLKMLSLLSDVEEQLLVGETLGAKFLRFSAQVLLSSFAKQSEAFRDVEERRAREAAAVFSPGV